MTYSDLDGSAVVCEALLYHSVEAVLHLRDEGLGRDALEVVDKDRGHLTIDRPWLRFRSG